MLKDCNNGITFNFKANFEASAGSKTIMFLVVNMQQVYWLKKYVIWLLLKIPGTRYRNIDNYSNKVQDENSK
ncbi:hypothetical protein RCL_jg9621.t1 [Rhizophagus clarus]|uniref:Uncharacterized protein n=1 Tax=Rhizophagus clarus TaxID=94130 RepID=A0A8H3QX88_9GLOM|nr:hypothetical protein RCL_jg9621.t1 [Rhizophagus clarus]